MGEAEEKRLASLRRTMARADTSKWKEPEAKRPKRTGVRRDSFDLRFTIPGKPAVLKNSKIIVTKPFPRLVPSKVSREWARRAEHALTWHDDPIAGDVWVQIVTYAHDRRRRDLDNSLSGPLDALVAAGVLGDDAQVKSLDGSRLLYDKENPRVEIRLRPFS
jgi:Holliday junction resolvase RusA-like endonuclease